MENNKTSARFEYISDQLIAIGAEKLTLQRSIDKLSSEEIPFIDELGNFTLEDFLVLRAWYADSIRECVEQINSLSDSFDNDVCFTPEYYVDIKRSIFEINKKYKKNFM